VIPSEEVLRIIRENVAQGDARATIEEVLVICRTDLEALFNLQFLFRADADRPDSTRWYSELMLSHLTRMNELLCQTLEKSIEP
jgi:hypothetical protein